MLDAFGWLADRTGCGYLRLQLPLATLAGRGHQTLCSERMSAGLQTRTLLGQRIVNDSPSAAWQKLSRVPAGERPRLVYELDDDLWKVDSSSPIAHAFYSQPDITSRLEANLRAADAVTVTTEALADEVRRYNPNVVVIPNYLPAWLLEHERPRRDGTVTIGWGGSGTHAMDVAELGGQLRQVMRRNPQTELHLMGADYSREMGIRERVRVTPWTPSVPDYWRAIDYDIMLAPLRAHPFNASKSPLRPLEAAALGIPVIASDYGPYAEFVRHGVTGYLVRRDHEWGRYLGELVNDPAARAEMGAAARQQAAGWTIEGHVDAWEEVLLG
ncbi:glycosyltransferase family 4 protein [Kitasatospora sp. NPDC047058]|uniref:glycosyltransferase family 4 protein n=1 Tax=Kitasatospora sp. NPDC047058 TaxID=3155620 RepID=UPI0034010E91